MIREYEKIQYTDLKQNNTTRLRRFTNLWHGYDVNTSLSPT